jgi:hypothetical protein
VEALKVPGPAASLAGAPRGWPGIASSGRDIVGCGV